MTRGEIATVDLINAIVSAQKSGASDGDLKLARDLQRKAQWRLDFIAAENSMGFQRESHHRAPTWSLTRDQ